MSSAAERVGAWFQDFVATESTPATIDAWVDRTAGEILAEAPEVTDDAVLMHLWGRASAWIDASVSASLDVYQAERDRIRRSTAAERLEWVKQVLEGELVDSREFSTRMSGYPVSGFNSAFVVHTHDDDAVAELDRVVGQLAGDLGSHHPQRNPALSRLRRRA